MGKGSVRFRDKHLEFRLENYQYKQIIHQSSERLACPFVGHNRCEVDCEAEGGPPVISCPQTNYLEMMLDVKRSQLPKRVRQSGTLRKELGRWGWAGPCRAALLYAVIRDSRATRSGITRVQPFCRMRCCFLKPAKSRLTVSREVPIIYLRGVKVSFTLRRLGASWRNEVSRYPSCNAVFNSNARAKSRR
jgi:hypothetical protein